MSNQHPTAPDMDDQIRSRLQTFARHVAQHADTEAALQRLPRRSRPANARRLAIAACLLPAIAVAAALIADRDPADTVQASDPPAENTDGATTLARGDVQFVEQPTPAGCCVPPGGGLPYPAGQGLGGQRLHITAEVRDGQVSGQARFSLRRLYDSDDEGVPIVVEFECADTETDDVILGGTVTSRSADDEPVVGAMIAMIIRDGAPDSATVWWDDSVSSCQQLLRSIPVPRPDDAFVDVVAGDDIDTGD